MRRGRRAAVALGSRSCSAAGENRDPPIPSHPKDQARSGIGQVEVSGSVLSHATQNIDLEIAGQCAVRRRGVLGFTTANECQKRAVRFHTLHQRLVLKQQPSCHMIEKQAIDEIERGLQRRLAIDSLAVAVRNSRNGKDVLPGRRTREPYKTQHRQPTVRAAHKWPSMVSTPLL